MLAIDDEYFADDCEPIIFCRYCSCVIGDEVAGVEDWGEGMICENCLAIDDEDEGEEDDDGDDGDDA